MLTKSSTYITLFILTILIHVIYPSNPVQAQVVEENPKQMQGIDVIEHLGENIPLDLEFINDSGDTVTLKQVFANGKPVIITLGYYNCPMLCSMVLNGLTDAIRSIKWLPGEEFQILTISIEPKETVELAAGKRHRYLESLNREGADSGWRFHIGDSTNIHALAEALGFKYYWDDNSKQYAHPAVVFVLTPEGKISRYLYGLEYKQSDIRLALLEASEGKIGTTIDKFILFCFHYDPSAGGYVVFAANVMKLGGAVVLAIMIVLLGGLWLKERHRKNIKFIDNNQIVGIK